MKFWFKIPRICPGYEAQVQDVEKVAEKVVTTFNKEGIRILDPLV